jgi:hypothetical protein
LSWVRVLAKRFVVSDPEGSASSPSQVDTTDSTFQMTPAASLYSTGCRSERASVRVTTLRSPGDLVLLTIVSFIASSRGWGVTPSKPAISLAYAEREAMRLALNREPSRAADLIETALTNHATSEKQKGWYLQVAARYRYAIDEGGALQTQAAAHAKNSRMLLPPSGTIMRPEEGDRADAATAVLQWYSGFKNVNGAVAAFQDVRGRLSFNVSADTMEQALMDLAVFVGAVGSRPEHTLGRGPDDLWLFNDASFVIEAKNEAVYTRLPKKDSGQLHDSLQWFHDTHPGREPSPVLVARSTQAEHDAHFPEGTRVLTPEGLERLAGSVEGLLAELVKRPAAQWTAREVGQLLARWKLTSTHFRGTYTEPVR